MEEDYGSSAGVSGEYGSSGEQAYSAAAAAQWGGTGPPGHSSDGVHSSRSGEVDSSLGYSGRVARSAPPMSWDGDGRPVGPLAHSAPNRFAGVARSADGGFPGGDHRQDHTRGGIGHGGKKGKQPEEVRPRNENDEWVAEEHHIPPPWGVWPGGGKPVTPGPDWTREEDNPSPGAWDWDPSRPQTDPPSSYEDEQGENFSVRSAPARYWFPGGPGLASSGGPSSLPPGGAFGGSSYVADQSRPGPASSEGAISSKLRMGLCGVFRSSFGSVTKKRSPKCPVFSACVRD